MASLNCMRSKQTEVTMRQFFMCVELRREAKRRDLNLRVISIDASIEITDIDKYIYKCKVRNQRVKGAIPEKDVIKRIKCLKRDLSRWQR